MAIALATATRDGMANAIATQADSGAGAATIKVYTGSSPGPNTAVTGTLLATFTCQDPAFATSSSGTITLDITPAMTTTGLAAGTAGYFRLAASTPANVLDGTVTATGGGGDLELNTTTVSVGLALEITGGTVTVPQ